MAMAPTVWKPSEMGAIPGIRTKPVSSSTMAAPRPAVITATMILPNTAKPRIMASSARHSPRAIKAPIIRIGTRFLMTIRKGNPAARPPTSTPTGMVTTPQRIPFAMAGRSSGWRMPIATGIVKTTVAPSMEPVMTPPSRAAWGSAVISWARDPPPISQARMVPANMAGSAPKKRYTGTTRGCSQFASTGARLTIPTMARAREPMARIPFSNSGPSPSRFPRMRSNAPSAAKAAMTAIRI